MFQLKIGSLVVLVITISDIEKNLTFFFSRESLNIFFLFTKILLISPMRPLVS